MTETSDETTTIDEVQEAEAGAVGEARCLACESLIPPNAIRTKVLGNSDTTRPPRARRVHLYCSHCDLTYELVQVRSGDGWSNSAMTAVTDRGERARVARDMAAGQGVTYVDRPSADAADSARLVLIARLDRTIAQHEERAAEAREQRAALMDVTPAEAAALGVSGRAGGQFPYVSGDMRHLMEPQADGDVWSHG